MRPAIAACCLMAVVASAGDAGVGRAGKADASAGADAQASARANADASADANADASANAADVLAIEAVHRAAGTGGGDEDAAIEEVVIAGDLPVYVVRPAPRGEAAAGRTVFLTGSCTTPLTYLKAIRHAAAEHGGIVALQGDRPCRDGTRRWSPDTVLTSARIHAALRAVGVEDATGVTLVGYSQGAERAEWLAHRFPLEYTRFVLMAGPIVPSHARFSSARGVVTLAGYGDVRENMADGARRLRRAAIPAIYMELPGLQHGELSPAAGSVVARAFDWLDANALEGAPSPRAHARGVRARPKRTR